MDGDEATRRIRASGASKSGFIVRWTTESALWLDPGLYDGQALKPINVPALAQVVSEAARRRCASRRLTVSHCETFLQINALQNFNIVYR